MVLGHAYNMQYVLMYVYVGVMEYTAEVYLVYTSILVVGVLPLFWH